MNYSKVFIESIGYELPPVVISSAELEERIKPVYNALHIPKGQLEALTGIVERRWWEDGYPLSHGAVQAAKKALEASNVSTSDIEVLIYAGVCRENFEPATACRVASELGIQGDVAIYDISNACLGVLNSMIDIANRIELGQIRVGMVVSCESAREINETMIDRMLADRGMELFKESIATLTGGSGAIALILTDGSFGTSMRKKFFGGTNMAAPSFYNLCRWYNDAGESRVAAQTMRTDSVAVLKHGVSLGIKTWQLFLEKIGWAAQSVDKVICHQIGRSHQETILKGLGVQLEKDFSTYSYLGNIGTVSLPITAAIADERGFLETGDKVAFLGIGSGLNCLMLGVEW